MWKVPPPDTSQAELDITNALTYANGSPSFPITPEQKTEILRLYELYDELHGQPSPLLNTSTLENELLVALHAAYNQVQIGGRLEKLRERLKLAVEKCPYCGFGEIRDLDHHIPRSVFKAHSIYAKNLVPCCHPCNNKKRASAGEEPATQYSHVYFSNLTDEEFLTAQASISEDGLIVNFSITNNPEIDADEISRLSFQFSELELNNRYKPEINSFLSSQITSFTFFSEIGDESFKFFLQKSHLDSSRTFGRNHWRTALWHSLAQCEDFWRGGWIHAMGVKEIAI
ncbi:HNH endonuclease [Pseudomonas sp. XS1P51]|jgi:hypothetical protein